MAKALPIEEQVLALNKVRADPKSDATRDVLKKALSGKSNLLAGKAAELASELQLALLLPDLHKSFSRFFDDPDKGCVAKTSIARAMEALDGNDEALFLRGIRHVQLEGAWGGSSDVAVDLRAACARAMARLNTIRTLPALTDLLGDAQAPARAAAAQSIGHCGRPEGALPLRLKIRIGDAEPAVIAECFASLLQLLGAGAIELIEPFLDHLQPELRDAAATTLGESKLPEAFALLRARFDREITSDGRRALLFGIALTRHPQSIDFLLNVIDEEPTPSAVHAVEALAIYRNDAPASTRIGTVVEARRDDTVLRAFQKRFPSP
ncbi:MAG: HEAT repeat domain-containing protein [Tepidisphaeraceae bacterium]